MGTTDDSFQKNLCCDVRLIGIVPCKMYGFDRNTLCIIHDKTLDSIGLSKTSMLHSSSTIQTQALGATPS